ncbi:cysteine desulfurase family protein [Lichenicola sp.]|uniref:cysteine desulfurase family protein n=1 Tax=Lichenicola sp. TaxID=2804529 RepID=UPI003AFF82F0
MTYLDANASEPLRPEARQAAIAALELDGNPASVHASGRQSRRALEDARERIATLFGADPAGLVFTSGGTESDALAIHALGRGRRRLIGATEHEAVLRAGGEAPGETVLLPVLADGRLDLDGLAAALAGSVRSALVCVMLANNETGVLHPVAEAAELCRRHGARLHVDAVQAAGRMPVSLAALGADSIAISAHKLGGPKGSGALLLAASVDGFHLAPLIEGGGQERGRRGGTPALPAICGFAAAADAACRDLPEQARLARLRDRIERAAEAAGAIVCGAGAPRLANTTCLALPGRRADTQLIALDLAGFAVSAGAACSSGKVSRSHVLEAMGRPDLAGSAIRVSLPWNVEAAAIDRFIDAYLAMSRATPVGRAA